MTIDQAGCQEMRFWCVRGIEGASVTVHHVLSRVQERAGLDRRGGHPLFAYRLSDAEEAQLGAALRDHFLEHPHGLQSRAVAGAFVLYAASHFCRTHEGGPWSWDEVLRGAGWPHDLDNRFYDLIEDGFAFWRCGKVVVSGDRRAFLRSVAVQGGLPLRLLAKESSPLRSYFSHLLSAAERYQTSATDLAPRYLELLPLTLQQEVVSDLAGALVDAVVALRRELPERSGDPIEALDRTGTEWRSRIPLRLDDEAAAHLLRGLLYQPEASHLELPALAEARLVLRVDVGRPFLLRRVDLADRVSASALAERLGVPVEELPPYFQLGLALPGGGARVVGVAQALLDDTYRLLPDRERRSVRRGPGLLGTVHLTASAGERELGVTSLAGGAAIDEEVPWVLRGSDLRGELSIRAFGSARTGGDSLLALLPLEGELELDDGAELEELPSPEGRRLTRLRGSAVFHTAAGERCRLASRAVEDPDDRYELRGELARLGVGATEAFSGTPRLIHISGDRERLVPSAELEWRSPKMASWHRVSERDPHGLVRLRHRQGDEVLFRTTATVLPRGLTLAIEPARSGAGSVLVRHETLQSVSATPSVGTADVQRHGAAFRVTVEVGRADAGRLAMDLLFAGGGDAHLDVPLPVEQRTFIGPDGESLGRGAARGVERLVGLRARAVELRDDRGACLDARVPGQTRWIRLADLPAVGPRVFDLPLQRVRASVETLLAFGGNPDTPVELRIVPGDGTLSPAAPTLHVRRQDARLEREKGERADLLRLSDDAHRALGEDGVRQIRVDARPLDAPGEEKAIRLPEIEPGVWRFEHQHLEPGPWLILGWHDQWCRLRPLPIAVGQSEEDDEAFGPLRRAMRIPRLEDRTEALDAALERLGADMFDPEWSLMGALLESLDRVPVTTFDAIRRLAEHPDVLASVVFRQSNRIATLWPAMERLPFLWATVPVTSWVRAVRRQHMRGDRLVEAEVYANAAVARAAILTPPLEAMHTESPKAAAVLWAFLHSQTVHCPAPPPSYFGIAREDRTALDKCARGARVRARQRAGDRRWPSLRLPDDLFHDAMRLVELDDVPPFCRSVLVAPVVSALAAVTDYRLSPEEILALRRARDFDATYFEDAYAMHLARLLADALRENPERFDDIH